MIEGSHIPQEDLALLAMQSLPEGEAERVRSHLLHCGACRAEAEGLLADLAMLGMCAEQEPVPESARLRFLASIAADAAAGTAEPVAAKPTADAGSGRSSLSGVVQTPAASNRRGWLLWTSWTATAAALALAVSLEMKIGNLTGELQEQYQVVAHSAQENAYAQRVLRVLQAPSAQRVMLTAAKTAAEPTGHAVYVPDRGELIFEASDLRPLPDDKTYELWLIPEGGKAPIPAGLFRPDSAGSASVMLPPLPAGVRAKAFGVTVEKREGSASPTAPILLSGAPSPGE